MTISPSVRRHHQTIVLFAVAAWLFASPSIAPSGDGGIRFLAAQEIPLTSARPPARSVDEPVTSEAIELGISQASSVEDEATKTHLLERYNQAKQHLLAQGVSEQRTASFKTMASNVASQMQRVEAELDRLTATEDQNDLPESLVALRQRLAAADAELTSATERASELSAEPARRQQRLVEIPVELKSAENEVNQTADQLTKNANGLETEAESVARSIQQRAKRAALVSRIEELRAEQAAYLATSDLLPRQLKLADQRVAKLKKEIERLRLSVTQTEAEEANDTIETLQNQQDLVPQSLRPIVQRNLALAQKHLELTGRNTEVSKTLEDIQQTLKEVDETLTVSVERLKSVGLTYAMGLMLREKRREFEQLRMRFQPAPNLQGQIQTYQVNVFQLEDEQSSLTNRLEQLPDTSETSDKNQPSERELLERQQELLSETLTAQRKLSQTTLLSDTVRRQLHQSIDQYASFVDENVFWIRSSQVFSLEEFGSLPIAARWVTSPKNWLALSAHAANAFWRQPIRSVIALVAIFVLLFSRPRLRQIIDHESKEAVRVNAKFRSTIRTLFATIGLAAFWPALLGIGGWWLSRVWTSDAFVQGVAGGLAASAYFIASRELLKEAARDDALAETHFGWSEAVRGLVRRHLPWYTWCCGLSAFFLLLLHEHPDSQVQMSSERLTTTLIFLVSAIFHQVMLRPNSPIFAQLRLSVPDTRIYRYRRVVWLLAVTAPLLFAALAMGGYLDTAFRLGRSLHSSVLLLVVTATVIGMLFRWLALYRRDSARREARRANERRLAAEKSKLDASESIAVGIVQEIDEEEFIDLPTLDRETRRAVITLATVFTLVGMVIIWSDVMPLIRVLDRIELWPYGEDDALKYVTLRDLIHAVLGVMATLFVVRNLPNLLELLWLRRSKLDSGAKYAITTIIRHLITVTGILVVLSFLEVPWSQLSWLVAAISVGLGFGLQEIVANFVSGIILLIERPVRVGDVVTIADTTGIVSRIQMRATTVTNWDRKELVVPNKDLITEKLLNWSLSNVINRLTLHVGVDYDANPDEVRAILEKVVLAHPKVMKEPAPLINLDEFGDNSLNFVVRFYLANLDHRVSVTHEVNAALKTALDQAGISIPFPQRDLHFKVTADQHPLAIALDPGKSS